MNDVEDDLSLIEETIEGEAKEAIQEVRRIKSKVATKAAKFSKDLEELLVDEFNQLFADL